MSDEILSRFQHEDLLEIQTTGIALADRELKISWYNQEFKNFFGKGRIRGASIFDLFSIDESLASNISTSKKTIIHSIPDSDSNVAISPIWNKKKKDKLKGFLVELKNLDYIESVDREQADKSVAFSNEIEKLLVLLVKENSLEVISNKILSKSVELSSANFGIIIYHDDKNNFDFQFYNPASFIKDEASVEKSIQPDLSFINKWLKQKKKSLLALNNQNNIGFHLTEILECKSLLIAPCFFEDTLLATLMVGKKDEVLSVSDVNIVEQLSALLSFAISNLKTRELNAALEGRLLQAQKLETIGKLSSGMAHDFSNLLSSIFGSLNLLRKRVPDSENTTRLIDNIENCSVRARDLTKGLLSFGKSTPKRKELVQPNTLLNEIIKVVSQTFPGSMKFIQNVDENLHNILGNNTEVYQVLLNLCVNAKEAANEKGTLTLSAKNVSITKKDVIKYPLLKEGKYVLFTVSDDGVGIEEENLRKIFDPYFSTKNKETVSGLGLYVSYGIIKAHQGMIDVSSTIGEGTTFEVYIPAYEPQKEKKPASPDKIILLADDEEMLSDLLAELLESNDYNVIKVSSGKEVLTVLTEEIKVDLLIIDYNMPEMNGLETIEQIRKLNFNMPVILSSGMVEFNNDIDLDKYNIASRVQKPYEFEEMLETIQGII
jgi:signal transduction histidine kinase/CheY-like chemotaxis protein